MKTKEQTTTGVTSPGSYRTIARTRKPRDSGNNDPGDPEDEGPDDPEATDANNPEDDGSYNSAQSVGTDTLDNSRHTMAKSRPNRTPKGTSRPCSQRAV